MSRLSEREFKGMNNPGRRALQRLVEYPLFKRMGLSARDKDVLEVGCGSGYGAELLLNEKPASYTGFDFMPEQIKLARKRLPQVDFSVGDAADMKDIADSSKDLLVVFGVLHHIPNWDAAVSECYRVLRPGGEMYIEEPDGALINWAERIWKLDHPIRFRLKEFEAQLEKGGFKIERRIRTFGMGIYRLLKSA
jgi:ubiquinone/menaquinone biosynthesis C-methylase UbiE